MTTRDIADRMLDGELNENEIDEYRRFCAATLFTLNERYGTLKAGAARWMTQNRTVYGSQAETERAWEATEAGQSMIKAKYEIQGVEALSDALEGAWFLRQREWREASKL